MAFALWFDFLLPPVEQHIKNHVLQQQYIIQLLPNYYTMIRTSVMVLYPTLLHLSDITECLNLK